MMEAVTASITLWDQSQLFILCVWLCVFVHVWGARCSGCGFNACILVAGIAPAVFYVIGDLQLYCIYLSL